MKIYYFEKVKKMADIKGLEKEYKKSQILVLKALKNNNVAAYQLFEAKQKEGIPLVNPVKKRERKEKKEKVPAAEKPEKAPKAPKESKKVKLVKDPSEPVRKRGRPAQPKKTE
jgi:hypothetical protein